MLPLIVSFNNLIEKNRLKEMTETTMTVVRSTLKYNLEKNIQQWTKVMRFLFYLIAFVHAFDKDFFKSLERVRFF